MSDTEKVFVGQIGVRFEVDTEHDLSNMTSTKLKHRNQNGEVAEWDATKSGTKLIFTTTTKDQLNVSGRWALQAHVVGPGVDMLGDIAYFTIYDSLESIDL